MVDNIRIRFERDTFRGTLENCTFVKENKKERRFYILSLNKKGNTKLWVFQSLINGDIRFEGSLRKWYYGDNSLVDFNRESFVKALKNLAKILDMSLSDLGMGTISYLEIGLNVRTRISCDDLLSKIVSYKNFYREGDYQKRGTLYFGLNIARQKKAIRTLLIYNKYEEIIGRGANSVSATKMKRNYEILKKHGYYFSRVEFQIRGRKAIKAMHLENMYNLNSLVEKWSNLYVAWTFHVAKILVQSQINDSLPMTRKERSIVESLKKESVGSLIEKVRSTCTSKTAEGMNAKLYREKKCINDVILKFGTYADYNTYTFKADVALSLIRHCKKESHIAVGALIRNLWKPTYTLLIL